MIFFRRWLSVVLFVAACFCQTSSASGSTDSTLDCFNDQSTDSTIDYFNEQSSGIEIFSSFLERARLKLEKNKKNIIVGVACTASFGAGIGLLAYYLWALDKNEENPRPIDLLDEIGFTPPGLCHQLLSDCISGIGGGINHCLASIQDYCPDSIFGSFQECGEFYDGKVARFFSVFNRTIGGTEYFIKNLFVNRTVWYDDELWDYYRLYIGENEYEFNKYNHYGAPYVGESVTINYMKQFINYTGTFGSSFCRFVDF